MTRIKTPASKRYMGKLKSAHLIETGIWLAIAEIGFLYSGKFNQSIEIYKFGASGWPRAVLALIVVAALGNLLWHYRYGDDYGSNDEPAASARAPLADADLQTTVEAPHETEESRLSYFARIIPIIALPFLYAYFLEGVGFYALTPVFIALVIFAMGERSAKWLLGVTLLVYSLLLFLFAKVLFVGLPVGIWHPFYDYSQWLITFIQNTYVLEFFGLVLLLPLTIYAIITAKGMSERSTAVKKAAMVYAVLFSVATFAAFLLGGPSKTLVLFDVLKWPFGFFG